MPTEHSGDQPDTEPITVTVKEAARRTGLSNNTIYTLANKGEIESVYFGRKRLIKFASLRSYMDALPVEPSAA